MFPEKEAFAQDTELRTLADALVGADCFVGLSVGGILSGEMLKTMAPRPIIFAMANPDPEITYEDALAHADSPNDLRLMIKLDQTEEDGGLQLEADGLNLEDTEI